MRTSRFLIATQKTNPTDASLVSHQLMVRAGYIRRLASGLYSWLPMGQRVLNKISKVITEELDKTGAQQVMLPTIQPAELWQESGRWDPYGPLMLRMKDRHDRDYCYGPTHEEVMTDTVRHLFNSYKQLPQTFYQIQVKFRDELRPRFGVMRSREFIMKDAYSFHSASECLEVEYKVMREAYSAIFTRLGLEFRVVLADSGDIGGDASEEFHVLSAKGEDILAYSETGDYAANLERATALQGPQQRPAPSAEMKSVSTPGVRTIEDLTGQLKIDATQIVKTVFVKGTEDKPVVLLVRADYQVSSFKAEKHPDVKAPLEYLSDEEVKQVSGCSPGCCGPIDIDATIIADLSVMDMADFVCGANQEDTHFSGVNFGRDLPEPASMDLREVVEGDLSPCGTGTLKFCRGIEVGHIFQLGQKYSTAMNATVLNVNGKPLPMYMGCYGIGVTRIVAAAIEQNHDDKGISLPIQLAPFHVALVMINPKSDPDITDKAEALYTQLQAAGIEVLLEDRKERPGVMFADMELIGIPHRLVISCKTLESNSIEYKARTDADNSMLAYDEVVSFIRKQVLPS